MSINNNTIKAVAANILLGDIELTGYQMPDGLYRYGLEVLAALADQDKQILSDKKSPYHLERLLHGDKNSQTVKVDAIGKAYNIKTISQTQFGKALGVLAQMGHTKALAILVATLEESLDRRMDHALGLKQSEEMHNEHMKARIAGMQTRRTLIDAIRDWLDANEVSDNTKKFMYSLVTDCLNKHVLGMTAKMAREFLGVKESNMLRDALDDKVLKQLDRAEETCVKIIDRRGMNPLDAMKETLEIHYIDRFNLSIIKERKGLLTT